MTTNNGKTLSGIDRVNQLELGAKDAVFQAMQVKLANSYISITTLETLLDIEREKVAELSKVVSNLMETLNTKDSAE
jgi:hypothetical protein